MVKYNEFVNDSFILLFHDYLFLDRYQLDWFIHGTDMGVYDKYMCMCLTIVIHRKNKRLGHCIQNHSGRKTIVKYIRHEKKHEYGNEVNM